MKQTTKRRSTTEVKDLATIWHTGLSLRRDWSSVDAMVVYIDWEGTGREGPRSDRSHRLDDRWAKQSTRSPGFHFNLVSLNEFNDTARRTWVFGRQAALSYRNLTHLVIIIAILVNIVMNSVKYAIARQLCICVSTLINSMSVW